MIPIKDDDDADGIQLPIRQDGGFMLAVFVKCEQCGTTVMAKLGEQVKTCKDHGK